MMFRIKLRLRLLEMAFLSSSSTSITSAIGIWSIYPSLHSSQPFGE